MKVGFVGLGAMGASMARNIAGAGLLASVWNRTSMRAQGLGHELKVAVADNLPELASQVNIVVCCVSADSDVVEVVNALRPGLKAGSVVVDTSTVSSETAQQIEKILAEVGVAFLDSPVSGGVEGARIGNLAMMVGGNSTNLEKVRPVLEAMGSQIVHMGPVGAGQATKAVNQIMAAGINQAVTEALAFGDSQALPMDQLIDVISAGAAGNWFLEHRGPSLVKNSFKPGFKLGLHHKDLEICRQMAAKKGFESSVIKKTLEDYKLLMDQGFQDEDISALYRLKTS